CRVIRNSRAIVSEACPAAHARMMRARCAKPCAVVRRRAHCSSVVRSLGLMITRTGGRPRFAIRASLYPKYERHGNTVSELQIRDTSEVSRLWFREPQNRVRRGSEPAAGDLVGGDDAIFFQFAN